jgi:hypothetical protein
MPVARQKVGKMGAQEAGAAGDEKVHTMSSTFLFSILL